MEAKDILGLIFTFLLLVLVQFLGRSKKRQGEVHKRPPPTPIAERRIEKPRNKREEKHTTLKQLQTPQKLHSAIHPPKQVQVEKKKMPSLARSLFSSRHSVRQAVIMQEILRRPYE